jgi:hypothetical protein
MPSTSGELDRGGANAGHIASEVGFGFLPMARDLKEGNDRGSFDGSQL